MLAPVLTCLADVAEAFAPAFEARWRLLAGPGGAELSGETCRDALVVLHSLLAAPDLAAAAPHALTFARAIPARAVMAATEAFEWTLRDTLGAVYGDIEHRAVEARLSLMLALAERLRCEPRTTSGQPGTAGG